MYTPDVGKIMDYESGLMDEEQVVEFFQELLDSGVVWHLQGSYQRMAMRLIDAGLIHYTPSKPADGHTGL